MKRIICNAISTAIVLSVMLTVPLSTNAASNADVKISIDDKYIEYTDASLGKPFIDSNDRTQVPLRLTMEGYGCEVDWDNASRTAIVSLNGKTVKVPINQTYILDDDKKVEIDTAAMIVSDRTYLPIRAVLEAFGAEVDWDKENRIVIIKHPGTGNKSTDGSSSSGTGDNTDTDTDTDTSKAGEVIVSENGTKHGPLSANPTGTKENPTPVSEIVFPVETNSRDLSNYESAPSDEGLREANTEPIYGDSIETVKYITMTDGTPAVLEIFSDIHLGNNNKLTFNGHTKVIWLNAKKGTKLTLNVKDFGYTYDPEHTFWAGDCIDNKDGTATYIVESDGSCGTGVHVNGDSGSYWFNKTKEAVPSLYPYAD